MNGNGRQPVAHDRRDDVAAYALGALEAREAEQFRLHLRGCDACRDELDALAWVAETLPMAAAPRPAPPSLRGRVLREVRAEPRDRRRSVRWRPQAMARAPRAVLVGAFAACMLAAAVVVGASGLLAGGSPGTRVIAARVIHSSGTAQLRVSGGRGELIVRHLPPPPAGRIYEMWLKRGNRSPSPTQALFSVTADGAADVTVPGDLGRINEILVTEEPAGGSLVSTHRPLIVAPVT